MPTGTRFVPRPRPARCQAPPRTRVRGINHLDHDPAPFRPAIRPLGSISLGCAIRGATGTSSRARAWSIGQAAARLPAPIRGPLGRLAWRAYARFVAWRTRHEPEVDGGGLPIPPTRLRVLVVRGTYAGSFLSSGHAEALAIAILAHNHGSPVDEMGAILDFGCGCGRVARHWANLEGPEIYGSDYDPELTEWCDSNIPFMRARVNGLEPPLPFDARFDLIYAISVFTHMTEELQRAWIAEFTRALTPGGLLIFTTHGRRYVGRLSRRERLAFERGRVVTRFAEAAGSNACATYNPEPSVAGMLSGLERLESLTEGVPGIASFSPLRNQDVHVARKTY